MCLMMGHFQLLRAVPFLLFPDKKKIEYREIILNSLNNLVSISEDTDGRIPPYPEYPYYPKDLGSIDSVAYALYVFTLGRHFIETHSWKDFI